MREEQEKVREAEKALRCPDEADKEDEREFSAERAEYEFEQCMKRYKLVKSDKIAVGNKVF